MSKKVWRWLLLLVAWIAFGGGAAWYLRGEPSLFSNQKQQRILKKKILLVALGDSLTHGQGDEKKQGGYVGQIKTRLENKYGNQGTSENFGAPGDRTNPIKAPLDTQMEIQTEFKSADVFVMIFGGNDLMKTLESGAFSTSSVTVEKDVNAAGKLYQTKLTALFKDVRKYNPNAQLFVFSIYNPFYTYFPNVTVISKSVAKWNQLTKRLVAEDKPRSLVDINHKVSYGQCSIHDVRQQFVSQAKRSRIGKITQKSVLWTLNNKYNNLNNPISTSVKLHPNHIGYTNIPAKLLNAMVKNNNFEYQTR
uniref:GDSL-like lipase/acylhydrolase n=1 Tax=Limosilactobacillus fermentum TaxID=1613 RepID=A0A3Q9VEZ6_LIMFE|nr:GDSL-like lipase/acylhydrolase [Limosilactobacillus fermentum]